MDRRAFLQITGMSSIAAMIGGLAYRVGGVWWDQNAGTDFKQLSDHEAIIATAIANALFPGDMFGMPSGSAAGVVEGFDAFLDSTDDQTARLLKLFLHAIDEMPVIINFGLTRFHKRPLQQRIDILKAWEQSVLSARRMAFRGLKFVFATVYCENPAVLRAAGIQFSCGANQ